VGILLPALGAARKTALDIQCKSQLRQFGIAFMTYAADNRDSLPPNNANGMPRGKQKTWLAEGISTTQVFNSGPEKGLIFPYVGETAELYLCPSPEPGPFASTGPILQPSNTGAQGEGNGKYDYSTFTAWNGAQVSQIRNQSTIARTPANQDTWVDILTPLLIEEDPEFAMNNGNQDEQHAYSDRVGKWHNGEKGNFTAIDGSTASFEGDGQADNPEAQMWYSQAPEGGKRSLGNAAMRSLDGKNGSTFIEYKLGEWGLGPQN